MTALVQTHIRWAIRKDLPHVLAIDDHWRNEETFLRFLRQRNVICLVAEVGTKTVGFMVYELHKHRLELINLGVHPAWRQVGVGTQLIDKLKSKLSTHRRTEVTIVAPDNRLGLHLFLGRQGFTATRVHRDHFGDGSDGYRFTYQVEGTPTDDDRHWACGVDRSGHNPT